MQLLEQRLIFSATDLSNFLACPHLSLLDRRTAEGGPRPRVFDDPGLEVLRRRGQEHEAAYLARLQARADLRVVRIDELRDEESYEKRRADRVAATLEAMHDGADVIYQGALFDGTWIGYPDFLERVDRPSRLGDWSYEVVDTKLAREAKGGALLQVLLYVDLLAGVQGSAPENVKLALGGPEARIETFRVADYAAYFRSVKARFLRFMTEASRELPVAVDPVGHCDICRWSLHCDDERRDRDHLSLVAGITRSQRRALVERGTETVERLAVLSLPPAPPIDGIGAHALERIREQARIQVAGRRAERIVHELLRPVVAGQGLAALPEPTAADLFLDFEGDPYALTDGLEYLLGFVDRTGEYTGWWAFTREQERAAFERFIDLVMQRLEAEPGMHIYHYGAYERTALTRLMGRYATREEEVDRLLRGEVLVDLHRVVRQGLRASVESYSIKRLEPLYGFTR
ncbi:MAG TPA: TM0106 family RecB-like putative nuclease, partial [Thermoanaerobaculia bacterium]|nr:TM0106 family RecB-like putative nuclease [Thermoanaerobaculia bacterium]